MKALILVATLSLAACEEPSLKYEDINWDNVPVVGETRTEVACEQGILLSVAFSDLMQRALDLNSARGGFLYIEMEKDKTELDILLLDTCGYEAKDKGKLI